MEDVTLPPLNARTDKFGHPLRPQRNIEDCDYHYGGHMMVPQDRPEPVMSETGTPMGLSETVPGRSVGIQVGFRPSPWRRDRLVERQGKANGANPHQAARDARTTAERLQLPPATWSEPSIARDSWSSGARDSWAASSRCGSLVSSPRATRLLTRTSAHTYGAHFTARSQYSAVPSRYMTGVLGTVRTGSESARN